MELTKRQWAALKALAEGGSRYVTTVSEVRLSLERLGLVNTHEWQMRYDSHKHKVGITPAGRAALTAHEEEQGETR